MSETTANAVLEIDLDAIAANWATLAAGAAPADCAGVVKADAYGLGLDRVAPVLREAGCRTFFVAQIDEGIALRRLLGDAEIAVLSAPVAGVEQIYADNRLMPVIGDLPSLRAWRAAGEPGPSALHVDTGMTRLGFNPSEVQLVAAERPSGAAIVMSHLACADEPDHPLNPAQRDAFAEVVEAIGCGARASLANSSGIFLGAGYRFDLARPGMALYGLNPTPERPNPMRPAVTLRGRILQVRRIDTEVPVGYGATARVRPSAKLVTIGVGYADGLLRSLSGRGCVYLGGSRLPLVGRVSMDLIVADATHAPEADVRPGAWVEIIGPRQSPDDLAGEAGTIGYEILTSLGHRYARRWHRAEGPSE